VDFLIVMQKICFILLVFTAIELNAQLNQTKGYASYYANKFEGKTTASGEIYRHENLTAAHRSLPFGTLVKVTNLSNNKSVVVRINDRGPFTEDRLIDLSKSAADSLGFLEQGLAEVEISIFNVDNESVKTNPNSGQTLEKKNTSETKSSSPSANLVPSISTSFFRLSSQKYTPTGFGVQVGSYQESLNLLERVSVIEQTLKKNVTIQVITNNGNRVYRLIIGPFETRAQAEYFKDSIKDSFPGFVVSF